MSEWKLIESAPRDGCEFFGWSATHGFVVCNWPDRHMRGSWHFDGQEWRGMGISWATAATHWMPLPEPPK